MTIVNDAIGALAGAVPESSGAETLIGAAVAAIDAAGQAPTRVAPRWEPAMGAIVIGLGAARVAIGGEVARRLDVSRRPRRRGRSTARAAVSAVVP